MIPYPLSAVRTLALYSQGLITPNAADRNPNLEAIQEMVEQVKYVQIDTLNLIQRSQYIALWSRLGSYTPADFDRLIYSPEEQPIIRRRAQRCSDHSTEGFSLPDASIGSRAGSIDPLVYPLVGGWRQP